ncbi:MAG: malto-oligosyltrehalose synthase [Desulfobacterales bacterium]|nr:malto-oligosyltrehalose synthase [Desulfobacterales bacterium]
MRIPIATYRIQFTRHFALEDGRRILPYLSLLGISDLYASPIFKARKQSLHGYDVVDPNLINAELGGSPAFEALSDGLKRGRMGLLQDIVPNHMAFDRENTMLMDLLEKGARSKYVRFFDIAWDHPYPSLRQKLLAPFLGKFYGEALEEGEIKISYDHEGFRVHYYDLSFPLKIESYGHLLTNRWGTLKKRLGKDHPDLIKLSGILSVLKSLASPGEGGEVDDQISLVKRTLWELFTENEAIRSFMDENLRLLNGQKEGPDRFSWLNDLLSGQLFRLSFWKVATEEINYRRFFSINDLISLRVEEQEVFDHTHALVLRLVKEGKITGLRIDHIDGLYDPKTYLERLRQGSGGAYTVVEKILHMQEDLPPDWPVQGTSGYDFTNVVTGVLCQRGNRRQFARIYGSFTGLRTPYDNLVYDNKRLILERHMAGDIDNLAHHLKGLSGKDRFGSDITLYGLKKALTEVMAAFPVYRTYVGLEGGDERDHAHIRRAVEASRERNPGLRYELDFVERFLLLDVEDTLSEEEKAERTRFVMRFQQFTGPLMAKGFEDTVLYLFNRLLSLNEVGGNPDQFGVTLEGFHDFCKKRAEQWPHSLNATSTHDTKRGEDVRARINVLSELPGEWEKNLKAWSKINAKRKRRIKGLTVPDRNDEYFLYQTLLGVFPFGEGDDPEFMERMRGYIVKAVREAKVHTAWLKPDMAYEEAYLSFLEEILAPSKDNPFLKAFLPFQKKIAYYGIFNSLSQTLLKIAAPGIPDFYQGSELWDLHLVDPDNRRPVDFEKRRAFLHQMKEEARKDILKLMRELLASEEDGRVKLFLIHRALRARHEKAALFRQGTYLPLAGTGKYQDHVIAFARNHEEQWAVAVVPRFLTGLVQEGEYPMGERVWSDTGIILPVGLPTAWKDAITDQEISPEGPLMMGEVLKFFPVSLMIGKAKGRRAIPDA